MFHDYPHAEGHWYSCTRVLYRMPLRARAYYKYYTKFSSSNTDSILSHETEALTILDCGLRDSLPGRKTDVTRRLPYLQQATSPLLLGNLVVSSSRMTQL